MPGRVLSEPKVQPAEVPARVAPAGVPAGRVPATKVAASGVAAPASVLRLREGKETDHAQQDRKDAPRPQKEGNSSGHGLPPQGMWFQFTPVRGGRECMTFSSQLSAFSLGKCWGTGVDRIPVEAIDKGRQCCNFREPLCVRLPPFLKSITELTIDQEQATRSQTATVLNLVSAEHL